MEDHTLAQHIKTVSTSYKNVNKSKILNPTPAVVKKINFNDSQHSTTSADSSIYSNIFTTPEQTFSAPPGHDETLQNSLAELSIANETLKTQLNLYQQQNDQLTEQKMKLSQQLGIQTQVCGNFL